MPAGGTGRAETRHAADSSTVFIDNSVPTKSLGRQRTLFTRTLRE